MNEWFIVATDDDLNLSGDAYCLCSSYEWYSVCTAMDGSIGVDSIGASASE